MLPNDPAWGTSTIRFVQSCNYLETLRQPDSIVEGMHN